MNHYSTFDYPERGKPKPKVKWSKHHSTVLRALFYLQRKGALATDNAIWDVLIQHGMAGKPGQIQPSGARTRRHELVHEFKLASPTQRKGRTESGKPCGAVVLNKAGIAKAQSEWEAARQLRLDVERAAA